MWKRNKILFRIRRRVLCSFLLEAKIIFYFSLSRRFEKRKRKRRRKRKDNRSRENGEPPRKDAFSICEAEEQTLSCGAKLVRPRGTSKVRSFQTRSADNASRKLYPNEMDLSLSMLFRISPISKL